MLGISIASWLQGAGGRRRWNDELMLNLTMRELSQRMHEPMQNLAPAKSQRAAEMNNHSSAK